MHNRDWRCYKNDHELPLSKRLAQELISSPLLSRDPQPKKSTRSRKNLDVNLLFDDEKKTLKTRRTDKLREVINLNTTIKSNKHEKIERYLKWPGPLNATAISHFVEVDANDSAGVRDSLTSSRNVVSSSQSSISKEEGENVDSEGITHSVTTSLQKEYRALTVEKKQNKYPIKELPKHKLAKMTSHVRLQEQELKELHQNSSERKTSTESASNAQKSISGGSLKRNLSKFRGPLVRQISELNLNLVGQSVSDNSMETYNEPPNGTNWSTCAYAGFEVGQHCHTVATTIFSKGVPEPCLSSSSSSDDLFQSTKYSRDIIEEKLRGLELGKKEEMDNLKDVMYEKKKEKVKSKIKSKCKCCDKKDYHSKCSKHILSKTDKELKATAASRDSPVSEDESVVEPTQTSLSHKELVAESQSISEQDTKGKPADSLGKTLPGSDSANSSSSEETIKRPCNVNTCTALSKGTQAEDLGDRQKPSRPTDLGKGDPRQEDEKLAKNRSESSDRIPSSGRLKSGLPSTAESSVFSMRPVPEFCVQETCELYKTLLQKHKNEPLVSLKHSKRKHSHHSPKRSEICSPKTCKASRSRSKKRPSSKPRKKKFKDRIGSRRWKQKRRHFICDCQNVYVGDSDSDTDDLWSDKGMKRSRNRRYNLTFENLKENAVKKCGGYVAEGHTCNCFTCGIKKKPWKRFMKMPNAMLDIPYILTTETLKERAQKTNALSKKLRNKYNWSEENLKNYYSRHEICKKSNLRKSLLQDNPFTWGWKWCHKHNLDRKVKKDMAPKEQKPGKFGYYVEIREERLTRGEHFANIQKIIEKVVYCKWNQDVAEMKLNHFLENMPKQQTCYADGKAFDPDRKTCYNPMLVQRLGDIVKFSDDPDRRIHEFSFPPKLVKYEEPQLVGDIGTDFPEIRPAYETAKFPTIYRDLFKDRKKDQRKLMDTLLPPLQWTDKAGLWEMKVSIDPDTAEANRNLINYLNYNETLCHAINKNFCAGRYRLYFEVFAEVIRQELIDNPERAFLLGRIREEFLLTMLLYDGGLEMTLVSTTHLWKDIEADKIDIMEKTMLEKEINDLEGEIKAIIMAVYELEKQVDEQSQTRDYQHKDLEKLYKNTNHQLAAQFETIKAGLLYDLD